jgi:hypothetical protein
MCGKIAETLAVEYSRVTDAYGGYFNNPSPSLPKAKAATTTTKTTNTTAANKTRMLNATNATNATKAAPKQTEWKINMFVQPDPFAKTVDNAATVKAATGDNVLTAVNSVTGTAFGKLTKANMVAAAVTEAAVKWVKKPTGPTGPKQIEIGGSVDVAAYVYCGVSKTAARFRMLNATNASNTTTAATTPAAKPTVAVNLQSADSAAKYTIQRKETTAKALTFNMVFASLTAGKTYSWMCEATSLSPTNPAFRTEMVKGSTGTNAETTTVGDSALWSSLFAAVLMIAAVFFY